MTAKPFIGREDELEKLAALKQKAGPSLVVIKGRRRIGKSRLAAEFARRSRGSRLWSFAGLAPQGGVDAQSQRDHFARQLARILEIPPLTFQDWSDALEHLSLHLRDGDLILFDEISWMGSQDPTFIPKLKAWWDRQQHSLMLLICGSVSTWIEDNILNSTAFFGRVNLTLTLLPLSISQSFQLLKAVGFKGSAYEYYLLLSILGGIPWYLEQATAGVTASDLIWSLCFEREGLLFLEFERIFHDLFDSKGATYRNILTALQDGMQTLAEVRQNTHFPHSGTLSRMMEQLITAGFIAKQELWSFKTTKPLKQSLYRICDPYMRFYLKVIQNQNIKQGGSKVPLSSIPGFDAHMGLQLEYLLLQNRELILRSLGVLGADIVCDGPYRQSKTASNRGCQIDYLIQTRTKSLFVCEFKFKQREIGAEIIDSVEDKIKALRIPRGFAAVPVLFHIGGVTAAVETAGYFYRVVDITDFLVKD